MRYKLYSLIWLKNPTGQKQDIKSAAKDMEKFKPLYIVGRTVNDKVT